MQEINKQLHELTCQEKVHVHLAKNAITSTGRRLIYDYLASQHLPYMPEEAIEWVWSTKRGTFPKRLAKWYKVNHQIAIDALTLSEVGNIASYNAEEATDYTIDFTKDIHSWQSGDFGDHGSCYWTCRNAARDMLENMNSYAVRFYEARIEGAYESGRERAVWGEGYRGYARAWLTPITYEQEDVKQHGLVLWNAYGIECLKMARTLASYLGVPYKKIELWNNSDSDGMLWINGAHGYLLGSQDMIDRIDAWDFREEDLQPERVCCVCGETLDGDDDNYYTDEDDNIYCSDCWHERFVQCEWCDEWIPRDEAIYAEDTGDPYCQHCADRHLYECSDCGNYYTESLTEVEGMRGDGVCEHCLECGDYTCCDHCDTWIRSEDAVEVQGDYWCHDCATQEAFECEECGAMHFKTQHYYDQETGKHLCRECYEDAQANKEELVTA
ncbi:MAG: hypothetical protein HF312_15715 [Ignavibacteria bacterium]|jgi:hypothetical protein|nr:hypothetical protein [Ignavibacteria bacterium]